MVVVKSLENVSIVIPSFNGIRVMRECLETLLRECLECEIIVADGGSTDGSKEVALELAPHFGRFTLLEIPNHGWAHATNRGFEIATGAYLVTMNSDLFITRPALLSMRAQLEGNAKVGGASPVLLNGDGSRQPFFGYMYWPNLTAMKSVANVNLIYGCCAMIPRSALERVGLFDERFFFYNEEFDWCWRAAAHGYGFRLVPERVVHLEGSSTPSHPNFQLEAQRGGLYLIDKHFPRFWSEATRRMAQLLGFAGKRIDPDVERRNAWRQIEIIAKRGRSAYLDSPFPLSGRLEPHLPAGTLTPMRSSFHDQPERDVLK
jgi:N-acetylglucosaminyl-diphospho-decaprenol L-rhamnosyltransferase